MDIIEKARELGKMIQQDERYKAYYDAKEKNDKDEELQALIGEFNLKRVDLNREMSKDDKDMERLESLIQKLNHFTEKLWLILIWRYLMMLKMRWMSFCHK